jgi:hypothetical protein
VFDDVDDDKQGMVGRIPSIQSNIIKTTNRVDAMEGLLDRHSQQFAAIMGQLSLLTAAVNGMGTGKAGTVQFNQSSMTTPATVVQSRPDSPHANSKASTPPAGCTTPVQGQMGPPCSPMTVSLDGAVRMPSTHVSGNSNTTVTTGSLHVTGPLGNTTSIADPPTVRAPMDDTKSRPPTSTYITPLKMDATPKQYRQWADELLSLYDTIPKFSGYLGSTPEAAWARFNELNSAYSVADREAHFLETCQRIMGAIDPYVNKDLKKIIKQERSNPKHRLLWNLAEVLNFTTKEKHKAHTGNVFLYYDRIQKHYHHPTRYAVKEVRDQLHYMTWDGIRDPSQFVSDYIDVHNEGESIASDGGVGLSAFTPYSEYEKVIELLSKVPHDYARELDLELSMLDVADWTVEYVKNALVRKWRLTKLNNKARKDSRPTMATAATSYTVDEDTKSHSHEPKQSYSQVVRRNSFKENRKPRDRGTSNGRNSRGNSQPRSGYSTPNSRRSSHASNGETSDGEGVATFLTMVSNTHDDGDDNHTPWTKVLSKRQERAIKTARVSESVYDFLPAIVYHDDRDSVLLGTTVSTTQPSTMEQVYKSYSPTEEVMIWDTGAVTHNTCRKGLLEDIRQCEAVKFKGFAGGHRTSTQEGELYPTPKVKLSNVKYVPSSGFSLMSIGSATYAGLTAVFSSAGAQLVRDNVIPNDVKSKIIRCSLLHGRREGTLFVTDLPSQRTTEQMESSVERIKPVRPPTPKTYKKLQALPMDADGNTIRIPKKTNASPSSSTHSRKEGISSNTKHSEEKKYTSNGDVVPTPSKATTRDTRSSPSKTTTKDTTSVESNSNSSSTSSSQGTASIGLVYSHSPIPDIYYPSVIVDPIYEEKLNVYKNDMDTPQYTPADLEHMRRRQSERDIQYERTRAHTQAVLKTVKGLQKDVSYADIVDRGTSIHRCDPLNKIYASTVSSSDESIMKQTFGKHTPLTSGSPNPQSGVRPSPHGTPPGKARIFESLSPSRVPFTEYHRHQHHHHPAVVGRARSARPSAKLRPQQADATKPREAEARRGPAGVEAETRLPEARGASVREDESAGRSFSSAAEAPRSARFEIPPNSSICDEKCTPPSTGQASNGTASASLNPAGSSDCQASNPSQMSPAYHVWSLPGLGGGVRPSPRVKRAILASGGPTRAGSRSSSRSNGSYRSCSSRGEVSRPHSIRNHESAHGRIPTPRANTHGVSPDCGDDTMDLQLIDSSILRTLLRMSEKLDRLECRTQATLMDLVSLTVGVRDASEKAINPATTGFIVSTPWDTSRQGGTTHKSSTIPANTPVTSSQTPPDTHKSIRDTVADIPSVPIGSHDTVCLSMFAVTRSQVSFDVDELQGTTDIDRSWSKRKTTLMKAGTILSPTNNIPYKEGKDTSDSEDTHTPTTVDVSEHDDDKEWPNFDTAEEPPCQSDADEDKYSDTASEQSTASSSGDYPKIDHIDSPTSIEYWHAKCGHVSIRRLREICRQQDIEIPLSEFHKYNRHPFHCEVCTVNKFKTKPIGRWSSANPTVYARNSMDKWCADLIGPFSTVEDGERLKLPSYSGHNYALIVVDEYSRYVIVDPLRKKSDAGDALRKHINQCQNHTRKKLKVLHCDQGGEFLNRAFCDWLETTNGTTLSTTTANTSELNGIVERMNQTMETNTRCALHQADAPLEMWSEAMVHQANVHNTINQHSIEFDIPLQRMFGNDLKYNMDIHKLHIWGSDAQILIQSDPKRAGKFDKRAEDAVYLGYSMQHNTHTVLRLRDLQPVVSRNVNILDGSFKNMSDNSSRIRDCAATHAIADKDKQWVVNRIDDEYLTTDGRKLYRVWWEGYRKPTWEKASTMEHDVPSIVKGYQTLKKEMTVKALQLVNLTTTASDTKSDIEEYNEPLTINEALQRPDKEMWMNAIIEEFTSLEKNKISYITDLPHGKKAIGCKWVFKVKRNEKNEIIRYKARLVIQGFRQVEGVDYWDTFSPTVSTKTIKWLIALATEHDWEIKQMDFDTAFLNATLEEEVYMKIPPGYEYFRPGNWRHRERVCMRLLKALYGLKQAPRGWWKELDKTLKSMGYSTSPLDECLYYKVVNHHRIFLTIYVDDMLIFYPQCLQSVWLTDKDIIHGHYNLKDLGDCKWILNMELTRDRHNRVTTLSQKAYLDLKLHKYSDVISTSRTVRHPFLYPDISTTPKDMTGEPYTLDAAEHEEYRSIVGALLYAANITRVDIAYIIGVLARYMHQPYNYHLDSARRVLQYLRGRTDMKMVFTASRHATQRINKEYNIVIYSDSNHANDKADRKSTGGWISLFNDRPICWQSKKQNIIALSSSEAELYAICEAVKEGLFIKQWFETYIGITPYIEIKGDNQGSLLTADHNTNHNNTKHISIKYLYVREQISTSTIVLTYVKTEDQLADILTKATSVKIFKHISGILLQCPMIKEGVGT